MTDFRIGIDADSIERTVRESLSGLDETLKGLRDLHHWQEREVNIDETVEVGANAELSITSISGDVRVRGTDGTRIRIKAEGESAVPEPLRVERQGNRVIFNAPPGSEVEVEALVPRDCRVSINTAQGDVDIRNIGPLTVRTVDGDVTADGVSGAVTATTGHGDLTLERMTGSLTFHTVNGDLEVSDSRLDSAQLHSVDGEFNLDAALGSGPFAIQTVNGDVELLLPTGAGASVHFHTANGDISCDLPAEVTTSNRREWQAVINGGGPAVDIHTVNGDLEIEEGHGVSVADARRSSDPIPPVAPVPPVPAEPAHPTNGNVEAGVPASSGGEETTTVLQKLERGEISVDEAMEQLAREQ